MILFFLFIPIEIIGEFVKPFSLSMRLFGNIYGEDVINGLALGAGSHFFIPVQFLINVLQTFTDVVQAFIFALLTCAYISIMSETHGQDGHDNDFDACGTQRRRPCLRHSWVPSRRPRSAFAAH